MPGAAPRHARAGIGKSDDFVVCIQGYDSGLIAVQMKSASFHPFAHAGAAGLEECRGQEVAVALLMGQGVHPDHGISVVSTGPADLVFHLPSLTFVRMRQRPLC